MNLLAQAVVLLSLFTAILPVAPQDTSPAPGVEVIKHNWRKIVRNPALDDDPFRANAETADFELEKRNSQRVNEMLRKQGRQPLPPPMQRKTGMRVDPPSVVYLYEAKIRNTGTKTVQLVVWNYAFFDNTSGEEIGRTSCTNLIKLRPGKTVELVGSSSSTPIKVVHVSRAGKETKGSYIEQVVITRLEYDDGTFWQRPLD
jgi:hypothetical protein